MPVLNRDEFINRITGRVNGDTSDDAIHFVEDMTETYDSIVGDSVTRQEMEEAVRAKDEEWRAKYIARFNDGFEPPKPTPKDEDKKRAESIRIEDLFT